MFRRDVAVDIAPNVDQNLFIAFFFNGIGVPAAVTSLVCPVWAMVAMLGLAPKRDAPPETLALSPLRGQKTSS